MDCPRCGFSQPKDQFCANCGLNLEQFQPAPKPVTQKLASNPYIIGALVAFIIGGLFIYLKNQSSPSSQVAENTITRDESFNPSEKKLDSSKKSKSFRNQLEKMKAHQTMEESKVTQPAALEMAPTTPSLSTATAPQQLNIRFFEISKNDLNQLLILGKIINETSISRTVAFENTTELDKSIKKAKPLPGSQKPNLTIGGNSQVLFSNIEEQLPTSWELNLEITVNRLDANNLTYQFRGDFYFSKEETSPSTIELPPEVHTLSTNGAIVVAGIIPHLSRLESSDDLPQNNPLKIISSPDFRESLSEFIIVIQPIH